MVRRETLQETKKDELAIAEALDHDKSKKQVNQVLQRKVRPSKARPEYTL